MNFNKTDGSVYSRSGNVSQSENSSASMSTSDTEDVLVEEQEPSSSVAPNSATNNVFAAAGSSASYLQLIRQNCPWARRRYSPTLESLHDEVIDLFSWLRPTAEEIALRRSVFRRVEDEFHMIYPDAQVRLIGSVATNLFLPSSDIDISVHPRHYGSVDLDAVADAFRLLDMFDNVQVVARTDVPIVKLRHKDTKYRIDISFNRHHNVLKNVSYVNNMMKDLPELEPLVMVLKQFLAQNNLNQPFSGGMSSYGLILMVIAFLKAYSRDTLVGTPLEKAPLGVLLLEFFIFYAKFDYDQHGIRVRGHFSDASVVDKAELAQPANQDKCSSIFFIEDPLQRDNNVGKSAYNMMAIKTVFSDAYQFLSSALYQCHYNARRADYWGPLLSLLIVIDADEVNYRKMQREAVINNADVLFRSNRVRTLSCCSWPPALTIVPTVGMTVMSCPPSTNVCLMDCNLRPTAMVGGGDCPTFAVSPSGRLTPVFLALPPLTASPAVTAMTAGGGAEPMRNASAPVTLVTML